MSDQKRMIDSYEVIAAVQVGGKEFAIAVDANNPHITYVSGVVQSSPFGDKLTGTGGNDYLAMLDNFTQSISQEIEINQERAGGFPMITSGHVDTIQKDQNIENLVVAVKPDSLPSAYRTADQQIFVVTGGAGSMENADPLKAVFVKNLYDGTKDRFVRAQFMGIVKPQHLPDWGHKAYTQHREAQQKKNKNAPER